MKKRIAINTLVEIEQCLAQAERDGVISCTAIANQIQTNDDTRELATHALLLAQMMPYHDIQKKIEEYDKSSPKMDELRFVVDLAKKYNVQRSDVIQRIQHVRRLIKYYNGIEEEK